MELEAYGASMRTKSIIIFAAFAAAGASVADAAASRSNGRRMVAGARFCDAVIGRPLETAPTRWRSFPQF
jgi:hypothetical protein